MLALWFGLPYNLPCNNLQIEHASQAPHWRKQVDLQRLCDNFFAPKRTNPSTADPTPQNFPTPEEGARSLTLLKRYPTDSKPGIQGKPGGGQCAMNSRDLMGNSGSHHCHAQHQLHVKFLGPQKCHAERGFEIQGGCSQKGGRSQNETSTISKHLTLSMDLQQAASPSICWIFWDFSRWVGHLKCWKFRVSVQWPAECARCFLRCWIL